MDTQSIVALWIGAIVLALVFGGPVLVIAAMFLVWLSPVLILGGLFLVGAAIWRMFSD